MSRIIEHPENGISLKEVNAKIASGSGAIYLEDVCTSPKNNLWSKSKSIKYNSDIKGTVWEKGISMSRYSNLMSCSADTLVPWSSYNYGIESYSLKAYGDYDDQNETGSSNVDNSNALAYNNWVKLTTNSSKGFSVQARGSHTKIYCDFVLSKDASISPKPVVNERLLYPKDYLGLTEGGRTESWYPTLVLRNKRQDAGAAVTTFMKVCQTSSLDLLNGGNNSIVMEFQFDDNYIDPYGGTYGLNEGIYKMYPAFVVVPSGSSLSMSKLDRDYAIYRDHTRNFATGTKIIFVDNFMVTGVHYRSLG